MPGKKNPKTRTKSIRSTAGKGLANPRELTPKEEQSLAGHVLGHPAHKKAHKKTQRKKRSSGGVEGAVRKIAVLKARKKTVRKKAARRK
jgi:hypothetical protein